MSDERPQSGPAPRYGEYAPTPAAPPPAAERSADRIESAPVPETASTAQGAARGAARPAAATPAWDRLITLMLLALGIVNVIWGIPTWLSLPVSLDAVYAAQGYGTYTNDGLASSIGVVINVVNVLLLIVAVALSVRRLRTGRVSFWIPLVAAVSALVVTIALLFTAMLGDPALPAFLSNQGS